ncbi:neprilysin-1-like isoform X1 [Trichogramma pretiosum]|uniref:neprilysin-1-like isoform X1 n=2 Tax=Trichogramma pretiosum TaxID=7493 RepID=UPI0006C9DF18|nr:neprilysin-1-like isoform X1 [Trichogramma pretiosum]XP_023316338.1 neprilysin-1-like isoform X1 [Trichogramma pretiosum]
MPRDQGAGQSYDDGHGLEEPMVQVERPHNFSTWICCVPCYWLRRSKAVHKALLTFAMLLVTSLLVTSPVLFLITTLPEGDQPRVCSPLDEACIRERDGSEGVCNTQACHEAARRMLATMQRGVDPCKDFYQFACGNFRNRLAYQPTSSFSSLQEHVDEQIENLLLNKTGKMNGVYNKLGHFYNSCLEFKNKPVDFNPVYNLLAKLGGYISPKGTEPTDITPLVSSLLKITGASLFDLYIDIDLFDHNKRAIFLDLPKKYLSDDFINEVPDNAPRRRRSVNEYNRFIKRYKRSNHAESRAYTVIKNSRDEKRSSRIKSIIQNFIPSGLEPTLRSSEADQLLQFCLSLDKIFPRHKDIYNWIDIDQRIYVPYNLSYLQDSFNYIRWKLLLNLSLDNATAQLYYNGFHRNEDHSSYIYVTAPHYFRSLGKLLNRFSKRMVHNGLLVLYATDILYDIVNVTANRNWSENCVKITKNIFSEAVGTLYVQQHKPDFLELLVNRVAVLFERIKETLAERMLVMPWLDEETRTQAIFRLRSLQGKFQIWHGYLNESSLAQEMNQVFIYEGDFFTTVLRRLKQIRTPEAQMKRNATQKWTHPYTISAYYEASSNSIVIPLAMMSAWSWSWEGGPSYAVYATLGSVISHEVLHAFDLHHRRLPLDPDPINNHWSWITPDAWHRLEVMVECVAKLYARSFWKKVQFFGNSVDVQFDWNITRNENVADIGSLQIAYHTWHTLTNGKDRTLPGMEALRPSQLFFISVAQTYCSNMTAEAYILSVELDYHTPQPERINGIMMNSPEFADAFRCTVGTKMNPPKKCKTW